MPHLIDLRGMRVTKNAYFLLLKHAKQLLLVIFCDTTARIAYNFRTLELTNERTELKMDTQTWKSVSWCTDGIAIAFQPNSAAVSVLLRYQRYHFFLFQKSSINFPENTAPLLKATVFCANVFLKSNDFAS